MTDAEVLAALDDRQTLALTAWAEARAVPRDDDSHSPVEELIAVMVTVRNRLPHFASWHASAASYKAACLAPNQFSCWNTGMDANHLALMAQARLLVGAEQIESLMDAGTPIDNLPATDPLIPECLYLADGVISGVLLDRTGGATQYWAPAAMIPPGRIPNWGRGKPTLLIGNQLFVRT